MKEARHESIGYRWHGLHWQSHLYSDDPSGYDPVILDNLYNSKVTVLDRIEKVIGVRPQFVQGDIRDKALLVDLMQQHNIEAVVHFAGLKAVGESVQNRSNITITT